jgi:hypothetical protein
MQIYWDQIFFTTNEPGIPLKKTTLAPVTADLHYRGYSRMYRKGQYGPHWFDYSRVTTGQQWRDLIGFYTRYGDVTELLLDSDDRYVIMNAGDEITITFDAGLALPSQQAWTRDFLLYTDGWIKDGDLNTAFGKTVAPLPFHAMSRYPYDETETYPRNKQHQDYLKTYNTRKVTTDEFRRLQ